MYTKKLPSALDLQNKYYYNPRTGLLSYQPRWCRTRDVGALFKNSYKTVGNLTETGYISTTFNKEHYLVHRLIWKMMTGDDPCFIDHINGERSDNRWSNLRSCDTYLNASNIKKQKNNTSGCTGVAKHCGGWRCYLMINRRQIGLGCFKCKICAFLTAKYCRELRNNMLIPYRPDSYTRINDLLLYKPCAKMFNRFKKELISFKPELLPHLSVFNVP